MSLSGCGETEAAAQEKSEDKPFISVDVKAEAPWWQMKVHHQISTPCVELFRNRWKPSRKRKEYLTEPIFKDLMNNTLLLNNCLYSMLNG